jgi:hypothetical protein
MMAEQVGLVDVQHCCSSPASSSLASFSPAMLPPSAADNFALAQ